MLSQHGNWVWGLVLSFWLTCFTPASDRSGQRSPGKKHGRMAPCPQPHPWTQPSLQLPKIIESGKQRLKNMLAQWLLCCRGRGTHHPVDPSPWSTWHSWEVVWDGALQQALAAHPQCTSHPLARLRGSQVREGRSRRLSQNYQFQRAIRINFLHDVVQCVWSPAVQWSAYQTVKRHVYLLKGQSDRRY